MVQPSIACPGHVPSGQASSTTTMLIDTWLQSGQVAAVKSRASRRTVEVGQVVIDDLAAHLTAHPSTDALFVDEFGHALAYMRWKATAKGGYGDVA